MPEQSLSKGLVQAVGLGVQVGGHKPLPFSRGQITQVEPDVAVPPLEFTYHAG